MLTFVLTTISITVAIILSGVITLAALSHPKVIEWYVDYALKLTKQVEEKMFDQDDEL